MDAVCGTDFVRRTAHGYLSAKKLNGIIRYTGKVAGVLLIFMGIMMMTGRMNSITGYLSRISGAEALAFIFACTFSVPCLMALSTTYKESHSLKWTARTAGFYVGAALILSCIV